MGEGKVVQGHMASGHVTITISVIFYQCTETGAVLATGDVKSSKEQ